MATKYRISITNPGLTGNSAGFVDSKTVEKYGDLAVTVDQAKNKVRGVCRYQNIIGKLATITSIYEHTLEAPGGTATNEPSTINMEVEQVGTYVSLTTDNAQYENGEAIKYLVAYALSDEREVLRDYYHPEKYHETLPFVVGSLGTLEECLGFVNVEEIN